MFSITCGTCKPKRKTEYEKNGFEATGWSGMGYNIEAILSGGPLLSDRNPQLEPEFLRILNILLYGSDINKEGKLWDEIYEEGEKIPSDFCSRLNKLISPTSKQLELNYKIPKELRI